MLATGCGKKNNVVDAYAATEIVLSNQEIYVDGQVASTEKENAVYLANDIIYYEDGKDFTYGEGNKEDAHSKEEADAQTVVHISEPGNYVLRGTLSQGQIAVDLGENAVEDENATVTLILNGVDITCGIAPAIVFYQVYECGPVKKGTASHIVDTSKAGANLILVDDTVNYVNGAYVAKIYDEVELNKSRTKVKDATKLHKYDGAISSKMSMNISGEDAGNGQLYLRSKNEGISTDMHLTIDGGEFYIDSGNDGINCNKDQVSVITINSGKIQVIANGDSMEGDGIDSNGFIVIRGGDVYLASCGFSQDTGLDAKKEIYLLGGTVIASGNTLDEISDEGQEVCIFLLKEKQKAGTTVTIKNSQNETVGEWNMANDFSNLVISTDALVPEEEYRVWTGEKMLETESGMN